MQRNNTISHPGSNAPTTQGAACTTAGTPAAAEDIYQDACTTLHARACCLHHINRIAIKHDASKPLNMPT